MSSFFFLTIGLFSYWFFANPGEATSSESFQKWTQERQLDLAKQKLMETEIFSDHFQFSSLEVIYIGEGKPYFSWWGHLLLRFVGSGISPDKDFAVGFVADFNDYPLDKYKGLMGGYTVLPKLDILENYYREYVEVQGREFVRYPLASSQFQRDLLRENLKSWLKDPTRPGSYSFARNNCVGLMSSFLEESQFRVKRKDSFFPSGFISDLISKGLIYQSGKNFGMTNSLQ